MKSIKYQGEFPQGRKVEMSYLKLGDVNTGVDCNPVYTFLCLSIS